MGEAERSVGTALGLEGVARVATIYRQLLECTARLCGAAAAVVFLQLVLGATLRHSAAWDEHLPTGLLIAHIAGAALVTLVLGGMTGTVASRYRGEAYLTRPAALIAVLLVLQLCLGLMAYLTRRVSPFEREARKLTAAAAPAMDSWFCVPVSARSGA